jgi:pimeloyl-ACP methyl ester carboxylesterase
MPPVALAYDDVGAGPAVVLVHGHPFDRTMWGPQRTSLAGGFRVLTPDLRGYGRTPATEGTVTMGELAGDVWDLIDRLEIDDVAVVGLSMGGLVAMEMAIGRPGRVWALGLVATTAAPVTQEERRRRLAAADEAEAEGMAPLVRSMSPRLFGPHAPKALVAEIGDMMSRNNPGGAAAALRGRAVRPDYREGLRRLDMPAFVCTGTCDVWSTAEVTEELVGCLRHPRTLFLPDVGHLPNLECPEWFNVELADFLHTSRKVTGPGGRSDQ